MAWAFVGARAVRILLIEDDAETAEYVVAGLQGEGHDLEVAVDGRSGLFSVGGAGWDVLSVGRMLPGLDGLALLRTLRAGGITTPTLFLTTMGGIDDRVNGLNAGGDDYLVKPFAFTELVARVTALGRRPQRTAPETVLRVADLEVDLLTRLVRRGGQGSGVAAARVRVAAIHDAACCQVVTRTMLLENVWTSTSTHALLWSKYISRLRSKIDRGRAELIHTVRGSGYYLRAPA